MDKEELKVMLNIIKNNKVRELIVYGQYGDAYEVLLKECPEFDLELAKKFFYEFYEAYKSKNKECFKNLIEKYNNLNYINSVLILLRTLALVNSGLTDIDADIESDIKDGFDFIKTYSLAKQVNLDEYVEALFDSDTLEYVDLEVIQDLFGGNIMMVKNGLVDNKTIMDFIELALKSMIPILDVLSESLIDNNIDSFLGRIMVEAFFRKTYADLYKESMELWQQKNNLWGYEENDKKEKGEGKVIPISLIRKNRQLNN